MKLILYVLLSGFIFLNSWTTVLASESRIPEKVVFIEKTLELLDSDDIKKQTEASRQLVGKGIADQRVYQRIDNLIQEYSNEPSLSKKYRALGWLVKALASSGNEEYRPLLESLVMKGKGRIKIHSKAALKILEEAAVLTPILDQESLFTGDQTWRAIRESNVLLNSSVSYDHKKEIAINALEKKYFDKFLYDTMNQVVSSDFQIESNNKSKIQAYAFMAKAMAFSPRPDYVETIINLSKSAGDEKLRKYAASYIREQLTNQNQLESFRKNAKYIGQKFGSVNVFYSGEEGDFKKINNQVDKAQIDVHLSRMLDTINLIDSASENTISVDFTSYKRGDFSAIISLNILGQDDVDSFRLSRSERSGNSFRSQRKHMVLFLLERLRQTLIYIQ